MIMKTVLQTWVAGALAVCVAVCAQAQDLKTYKNIYETNSEAIRSGFQPKFDGLQQRYQKALESLKASAVKQGDLVRAKAAMAEIDRFQKAKKLPASLGENELTEIKALQSAYVTQYNRLETDMTAQLGLLTSKYEQALERFERELTKAEKIDAATEVHGERETAQVAAKGFAEQLTALKGPYYIGVFEVTQRQWELVMGNAPHFKEPVLPVGWVNYNDIRGASSGAEWPASNSVDEDSFFGVLRTKTGLKTLDLPTDAQWEYACRAGKDGPDAKELDALAWYAQNSGKAAHPVGQKKANAWGLYDMLGNVWEWCLDWHAKTLSEGADPAGVPAGSKRVARGGSWFHSGEFCSVWTRWDYAPTFVEFSLGLRVAETLP